MKIHGYCCQCKCHSKGSTWENKIENIKQIYVEQDKKCQKIILKKKSWCLQCLFAVNIEYSAMSILYDDMHFISYHLHTDRYTYVHMHIIYTYILYSYSMHIYEMHKTHI